MQKATWKPAMEAVFKHEGGYVDHPRDPGGATNMGITHKTLSAWRKHAVTKEQVKRLTKVEAMLIYEKQYGDPIKFDELPAGVDYAVLDFAVNSGPRRASKYLQSIIGAKQDGIIGVNTIEAVWDYCYLFSKEDLIEDLCDDRLAFMKRLKTWPTFGRGWKRRVDEVRALSLKLAKTETMPVVETIAQPAPEKADGEVIKSTADAKGVGAVTIGTVGTVLTEAASTIQGFAGVSDWIMYAFILLTILGAGITAYGIVQKQKVDDDGLPA